jgi:hypothetical protein
MSLLERLERFDRRWLFVAMGLAILVPLLRPLGFPTVPSPPVRAAFYAIDDVPRDAPVFVSIDVDPASLPELEPFFRASMAHLKSRGAKLVIVTLWFQAPPVVERWIRETLETPLYDGDRVYQKNVDYVWLGFREGKEITIANLGQDIWKTFGGQTADGTPIASIPMMAGLKRLSDFALLNLISAGFPGAKEYVQIAQSRYKLPMVAVCTAVVMTDLAPYLASGQLLGLAGGMGASAEYEKMVIAALPGAKLGVGQRGLDVLNVGHLVVIAAILFGNVIYFLGKRRRR